MPQLKYNDDGTLYLFEEEENNDDEENNCDNE